MSGLKYKAFKRLCDLSLAIFLIPFCLPIIFIFGILIFLYDFSNPIFISKRAGKNGKVFNLYKLRTMRIRPKMHEEAIYDYLYIFPFGKWIRSFSIDELPQILNILKGDLSFVGPRPLLTQYIPLYTNKQFSRHKVLPGLTGIAQVRGRNLISWERRLSLDVWYSSNLNFFIDLKIIFETIIIIINREGINSSKSVTMKPFKGTSK